MNAPLQRNHPWYASLSRCSPGASPLRGLVGEVALVPKVGLEPTPTCEDRILSPVRLPYSWYWEHVAVILKVLVFKACTIPP